MQGKCGLSLPASIQGLHPARRDTIGNKIKKTYTGLERWLSRYEHHCSSRDPELGSLKLHQAVQNCLYPQLRGSRCPLLACMGTHTSYIHRQIHDKTKFLKNQENHSQLLHPCPQVLVQSILLPPWGLPALVTSLYQYNVTKLNTRNFQVQASGHKLLSFLAILGHQELAQAWTSLEK